MLVIPFLAILAISIVGMAYAHWSDYITIEGTAEMGSLTLAFDYLVDPLCIEYYFNETTGKFEEGEYLGKDVGDCDAYYDDYIMDVHSGKEGYKKMYLKVNNAYPQYIVHTTFIVHNIGTIPIHLIEFNLWDPSGELKFWWEVPPPGSPAKGLFYDDLNDNDFPDLGEERINVEIVNFVCVQLDYCESTKGEIDIDFKQAAEECHDYTFMAELVGIQWNKYVEP
jgi:hypothetical protein